MTKVVAGGSAPTELDPRGVEGDLLLRLAQRGRRQVGVVVVVAAAGEGDLAGMAAQVRPALGEDQPRFLGPAVERQQHGRVGAPAGLHRRRVGGAQQSLGELLVAVHGARSRQMMTWTVPPSTDQAAPAT